MTHKHHIVPRHMGGTDDPSNIEHISIEDHAERHRVLWEQYGKWEDKLAWLGLSGRVGKEEIIRMRASEQMTYRLKYGDLKNMWVGKSHSKECRKKISDTLRGRIITDEHKERIGKSLKGKSKTEEHRNNLSQAKLGKVGRVGKYIVTLPNGKEKHVTNLTKFSAECGFPKTSLFNVSRGTQKSYKGFRVRKCE